MRRALLLVCLGSVVLVAGSTASAATPPVCPDIPLPDRLEAAPIAFVGALVSTSTRGGARYWRFEVDQPVKGPLGPAVDIRAPALTDAQGNPLERAAEVGVLAELDGAAIVTDSCGLTDPAALLSVSDEARGGAIKLVVGTIILGGVLLLCWIRLRRGSRPSFPGMPNDPGAQTREARGP